MRSIVVGTAGHIDHGKSSLVLALTGTDPDRLKEEKARGITIDLGLVEVLDALREDESRRGPKRSKARPKAERAVKRRPGKRERATRKAVRSRRQR